MLNTVQRWALAVGVSALFTIAAAPVSAEDWPQWRGPNRDGVSGEGGLLEKWPEGGPKLLWKTSDLGTGYSTPTVAGGKIYLLGTKGGDKNEHLIALDEKTGKQLWATPMGKSTGGYSAPKSSATIVSGMAYVIGSDGKLLCADADTGSAVWRADLKADFGGRPGGWAYAESPLIDGDSLICTPGGNKATVVALDRKTGKVKWQATLPSDIKSGGKRSYSTAGYSSAVVSDIAGTRQYVQFLDGGVVAFAATDGKFLWNYNEPANRTANCSTPIVHDGAVFAASAYGNGGGKAAIASSQGSWEAKPQYFIKSLQNHHGGMVLVDGHVYGTGSNSLLCVNYDTGEVVWQERGVGKGSVVYADGHIYHRSEKGPIALVEANPAAYTEKGRFDQPDRSGQRAWPHPVVANGRLYIRDWTNLLCYDIRAK